MWCRAGSGDIEDSRPEPPLASCVLKLQFFCELPPSQGCCEEPCKALWRVVHMKEAALWHFRAQG